MAAFADALRGGTRTDDWGWGGILAAAHASGGGRTDARRAEFVELVEQARALVGADDAREVVSE